MTRSILFALLAFLMQLASAHDLDLTLIKVERGTRGATIQVTTALSRLVQTAGLGEQPSGLALDVVVRERLEFRESTPATLNVDSQSDTLTWSGATVGQSEFNRRFDASSPSAQTIVATYEDGVLKSEVVLEAEKSSPSVLGMLGTGMNHILSGLDHILFVVGLALLGGGWKTMLKVLTAFTVAHSVTLLTAATGFIHGNPRIVEPLIALSIVVLALEGIWLAKKPGYENIRLRIAIAFGFGLLHGFGFAAGMSEIGLQGSQLLGNLFSFSAGIELGQMFILAPSLLLLTAMAKLGKDRARQLTLAASVGLGMVGCFWLVERVL